MSEFRLENLPPEMPYKGRIDDVELAHGMAIAMDFAETKRVKWENLQNDLDEVQNPIYGRTDRPKKEILELVKDARVSPRYQDDEEDGVADESDDAWLKTKVREFHTSKRMTMFRDISNQHFEVFGNRGYQIPTEFVADLARKTKNHYKSEARIAGYNVYFKHQATANIATLRQEMAIGDEEVFARTSEDDFQFPSHFFRYDDTPEELIGLEKELAKLKDIFRRKQAYGTLAAFFGQEVEIGTVRRQDVINLGRTIREFGEIF